MPNFNRRGFLQLIGAAAATPLLPALPGRAAVAGASHSKALWAGIYAKSGSVPQFLAVARGMGLSDAAIRGVGARSVGVRVSVAAMGQSISGSSRVQAASSGEGLEGARALVRDLLKEPEEDIDTAVDKEVEAPDVSPS